MAEKKQDIAPELLSRILTSFGTKLRENEKIAALTDKLQNGTATYEDAYEYALEVGTDLSDVFAEELSSDVLPDGKMYFNIANRVVRDPLTRAYNLIADECEGVQTQLNTAAGIALKAQRPSFPENRIKGFIDRISSEPDYDKVSWILKEPVKTYSQSVVDDSVKKNADFHYKAGLSPRIIRSAAAHCCEWCNDVAGTYQYPNVPKDVYRRHKFCRCQVEYDPRNGKRQDAHTRKWSDEAGYGKYREVVEGRIGDDGIIGSYKSSLPKKLQKAWFMTGNLSPAQYAASTGQAQLLSLEEQRKKLSKLFDTGDLSRQIRTQKLREHIEGTKEQIRRTANDIKNGKTPTSMFYASVDIGKIISGGGKDECIVIQPGRAKWYFSVDEAIGKVYNVGAGEYWPTKRLVVEYSKKGSHAYPIKDW